MGFANAQKVLAPGFEALDAAARSPAVLDALDCLRIAITMYDSRGRLTYANQHFDYLFRGLPGRDVLMGLPYGEIVRLEIESGEIGTADESDEAQAERRADNRLRRLHGNEETPQRPSVRVRLIVVVNGH